MARMGWAYLLLSAAEALLLLRGPFAVPAGRLGPSDLFYGLLLAGHLAAGLALLARRPRRLPASGGPPPRPEPAGAGRMPGRFPPLRAPELLFAASLLLFLFSYIYALNANMDYIQRFMATGGAVRLALDTTRERLESAVRYLPLLLLNLGGYLAARLPGRGAPRSPVERWALPLTILSSLLTVFAFPSFISLAGIPALAYVALVPLLLVLRSVPYRWGLFYGTFFGVLQGMLANFWLGTFSLISLQAVSFFFLAAYLLFLAPTLWLARRWPRSAFLIWPLAWVFFDLVRSSGFLGYPWGMLGTSQYAFTPLIQVASLTGVWGVSFLVLLVNTALAELAAACLPAAPPPEANPGRASASPRRKPGGRPAPAARALPALLTAAAAFLAGLVGGLLVLGAATPEPGGGASRTVRVALVQQNSDPRKDDYEQTFATLTRLTDAALRRQPDLDLVAWSETAFVPNIRRWSRENPGQYPLALLVQRFLAYQRGMGTWLLTGNDDYELVAAADGSERRLDYNASVLFSPAGERVATYHKVHLVPFTEYFPFQESLPQVYDLLQKFDVYLWEPGRERLVFSHPRFRFATPICFEDAFPDDIRRFVLGGAEVILNISNDYWSLTEVEARQHFINSLFRAVENRRVLLRSTASGLTGWVDPQGRLRASLPGYTEGYLIVDVPLAPPVSTFYTRYGDWFPQAAGSLLLGFLLLSAVSSLRPGRRGRRRAVPVTRMESDSAADRRAEADPIAFSDAAVRVEIPADPQKPSRLEGRWESGRLWTIIFFKN